jgi:hypothetical protein
VWLVGQGRVGTDVDFVFEHWGTDLGFVFEHGCVDWRCDRFTLLDRVYGSDSGFWAC